MLKDNQDFIQGVYELFNNKQVPNEIAVNFVKVNNTNMIFTDALKYICAIPKQTYGIYKATYGVDLRCPSLKNYPAL